MKKLIFLLITLLLTSLVSSCAFMKYAVTSVIGSDVEQEPEVQEYQHRQETLRQAEQKQKTLRQIDNAKERAEQKQKTLRQIEQAKERAKKRAEQKLTPQRRAEIKAWQTEYEKSIQIEREKQEAKYKRFKEEWVEFIQSGDGSVKNKTTPEVKKLVNQWEDRWKIWRERMSTRYEMWEITKEMLLEDFSLENFYKLFGKPWKIQYIKNAPVNEEYILWYTCKDGIVLITMGESAYDNGWVRISDLNIL